jgi:prevent-host-death family protein
MASKSPEFITVSRFKATCLAVIERVRTTGRPVCITRRGKPVAELIPPLPAAMGTDWLGSMAGTARISGDLVAPALKN